MFGLKEEFNKHLKSQYPNKNNQNEVVFIKTLVDVLGYRYYSYSRMVHHVLVEHNLQHNHNLQDPVSCEIADILMLFIDGENMRYTFMQNKYDQETAYGPRYTLRKVYADNIQWDLLHYRCSLTSAPKELPTDCLSSAILDSAASYGIFVRESTTDTVNMSYSIARDLIPNRMKIIKSQNSHCAFDIVSQYNMIQMHISGSFEMQGTQDLDEFELAAQNMLVGSPLDMSCQEHRDLAIAFLGYALKSFESNQHAENFIRYKKLIDDFVGYHKLNEEIEKIDLPFNLVIMKADNDYQDFCPRVQHYYQKVRFLKER